MYTANQNISITNTTSSLKVKGLYNKSIVKYENQSLPEGKLVAATSSAKAKVRVRVQHRVREQVSPAQSG